MPRQHRFKSGRISLAATASVALLAGAAPAPAATLPAVAVSPLNGTPDASPATTQISFLGAPARDLSHINVVGSKSGRHRGTLKSYSAAAGASYVFASRRAFTPGETVAVRARLSAGGKTANLASTFTIGVPYTAPITPFPQSGVPNPALTQSFQTQPALQPPVLKVIASTGANVPGDLFLAPFVAPASRGPGQAGPMIADNQGGLIWFRQVPAGQNALDFRAQQYRGKPVLTWWQGQLLSLGFGYGTVPILDSSYRTIKVITGGNGYAPDLHEFIITPQNTALYTVYSPVLADLSSAGGLRNGAVLDSIVQELDIKTGLVMFEWHAFGHIPLRASYSNPPTAPTPWDYYHVNSIFQPDSGHLIVSARNTWAGNQISLRNGHIGWTLGGKLSSFKMGPGAQFAWQHDIELLPGNLVTLFDDEAAPPKAPESRGLVLKLGFAKHHATATVVRQYTHTPMLLAGSQGNMQPLAGGNVLVGWGALPYITEFNQTGQIVFDAQLPTGDESYRAYRLPWTGTPADAPTAAAVAGPAAGTTTVYASWNGATQIRTWQVLAGPNAGALTSVAQVPRSGFETAIQAPSAGPFFAVRALDQSGNVLGTSPAVHV